MHIDSDIKEKVVQFLDKAPENMGDALGIEFQSFQKTKVVATMPVHAQTMQPFGLLHGGASVALAETLASIGAWLNVDERYKTAVGLEINANHIKAVRGGTVIGTAQPVHRGAQTQVWKIRIENEQGKLVCLSRCTLAVIDKKH